ncbi:Uncharacterized protein BP5553_10258 [Venustampulla echinocandica]|uniref:DUF4396 domain-containing protein n=1 Tax=Venustampulla echinocandica TaxID=2656787 RepID=A0A370T9P7_9HELO|nr:Uncharacterized protein BP5553_10258 [Venustampulla echinocandica]RDL30380.1 Uncharacterized protein BP5553_10258 [Venustampulla echinocandica]
MAPRGMVISSRSGSRYLQVQRLCAGFQSSAKTSISCNQRSQNTHHLKGSVRSTNPQPSTCRKDPESKVSVKDSAFSISYWNSRALWKRAGINTLRCLIGCTLGDFSAMWFLQSQHPELGIYTIMGISMASGLASSLSIETILLRYGLDRLGWRAAATTAAGMSMVSMLSMEAVQNVVDYHLMGGVVDLQNPGFWAAAAISAGAGFLTPLPYNYMRLRKYGKACH